MANNNSNDEMSVVNKEKILLIRMLSIGDVACIGLPALRFFQRKFPDADIHFLTFDQGADIIRLAEPDVTVSSLTAEQWPNDLLPAMEVFLGLAENIIGEGYNQIVNLDTAFMPCFLARFLKDAGQNISGNLLNISVEQLLNQFQDQSLQPEFVHDINRYMDSTFFSMARWHTNWWESTYLPDNGYPEYYLRNCCSFNGIEMNWHIPVNQDQQLTTIRQSQKVIALCFAQSDDGYPYPFAKELKVALETLGYYVWSDLEQPFSVEMLLSKLSSSDLLVTKASANQWFAATVDCPTLLICASAEPRTLMPDYATEQSTFCPIHAPIALLEATSMSFNKKCNCDKAEDLAESIDSIFQQMDPKSDE
ncbi:MAG: ADP-heptose:LPS heptosyltransferase [Paraglaciecola sp.]|jgi:ADP-heptose:LPS heptosyltransferase